MIRTALESLVLVLALALASAPCRVHDDDPPTTRPSPEPMRGVCYVGRANERAMAEIVELGANWIQINPFAYGQRKKDEPPAGGYKASRSEAESAEGAARIVALAKKSGLSVMIKPHVWFSTDDAWHGDIAMANEEDWQKWFTAWTDYVLPLAKVASESKADAFCIGTELAGVSCTREKDWRALIARIREIYKGPLTYSANWHLEAERVCFWDALDWIGVTGYFPLTSAATEDVEVLAAGWKPHKESLLALRRKHGRPLVFTEWGYKNCEDTAVRPWEWTAATPESESAQAAAYKAFFDVWRDQPEVLGTFVWKWFERSRRGRISFSPQGRAAETILRQEFERAASRR